MFMWPMFIAGSSARENYECHTRNREAHGTRTKIARFLIEHRRTYFADRGETWKGKNHDEYKQQSTQADRDGRRGGDRAQRSVCTRYDGTSFGRAAVDQPNGGEGSGARQCDRRSPSSSALWRPRSGGSRARHYRRGDRASPLQAPSSPPLSLLSSLWLSPPSPSSLAPPPPSPPLLRPARHACRSGGQRRQVRQTGTDAPGFTGRAIFFVTGGPRCAGCPRDE